MDKLNSYREIIIKMLAEFTKLEYANAEIQNQTVFDLENDHYLVMSIGWYKNQPKRIHGCLIHLDIIDGKVWVQRDGTDYGIANDLVAAGIPKEEIVLGFHEPKIRQYTDFAVV
ncbi:XisI protein [Oscillatoria salina]|uniref:XisI protein n=1 Tax=Oscillatoria salina TaxID=331517 RepID=UPI0013BBCC3A|nr:XisI protein [Oscillatoria salina]MBZ8180100.1 XisI protein [Oscillatoria salina IIICB1]NET89305.1 XisI protein [Kamptonema sp. SIO1D9]